MMRLVDHGWDEEFLKALRDNNSPLRIICPFIKLSPVERLLDSRPDNIRVITRFDLSDFAAGVSDVAALRALLNAGASIRGVQNLHSKLYIFGKSRAFVTSANLTEAGLKRNHEFGVVAEDKTIIKKCRTYFNKLWNRAGEDLDGDLLNDWDETVTAHNLMVGYPNYASSLSDFGADVGLTKPPLTQMPQGVAHATQAFVKLNSDSKKRRPLTVRTIEEITSGGSHWAVCYPANRRPRSAKNNAVIFIALFTRDSKGTDDIHVFGRAIGMEYREGRDDATESEKIDRMWKRKYPHYIRLHHAEFVAGSLENGVSLNRLMETLESDSFASTQRNAARDSGNSDPRQSYKQHPAVELSQEGLRWLAEQLEAAFNAHGKVPKEDIDALDRPDPTNIS